MEGRPAGRRGLKKRGLGEVEKKSQAKRLKIVSLFRPVIFFGLRENERIFGQLMFLRWPLDRSGRSKRLYMTSPPRATRLTVSRVSPVSIATSHELKKEQQQGFLCTAETRLSIPVQPPLEWTGGRTEPSTDLRLLRTGEPRSNENAHPLGTPEGPRHRPTVGS